MSFVNKILRNISGPTKNGEMRSTNHNRKIRGLFGAPVMLAKAKNREVEVLATSLEGKKNFDTS